MTPQAYRRLGLLFAATLYAVMIALLQLAFGWLLAAFSVTFGFLVALLVTLEETPKLPGAEQPESEGLSRREIARRHPDRDDAFVE